MSLSIPPDAMARMIMFQAMSDRNSQEIPHEPNGGCRLDVEIHPARRSETGSEE